MQRATSRQNPRLREAIGLIASARDRRKSGKCVLEGEHLVAVYTERHGPPQTLIVTDDALARPAARAVAEAHANRVLVVTAKLLSELAALPSEVGMIAVVPTLRPVHKESADFCVLLDDLQDPGNVGSILRSAVAAGVAQAFLSKHCAFAWSPKVLRAGRARISASTSMKTSTCRHGPRPIEGREARLWRRLPGAVRAFTTHASAVVSQSRSATKVPGSIRTLSRRPRSG